MRYFIVFCFSLLLIGCQSAVVTPVATPTAAGPALATAVPTPTVDMSSAAGLLATAAARTLALQTITWTAHITGSQNGARVEETETTCAINLPNEAYCLTQTLANLTNTADGTALELVQVGPEQWGRQGGTGWSRVQGARPRSIILHELFQFQGGRVLFTANQYVRSAAVVGEEVRDGQPMSIIAIDFDTQAYNLYETWYGADSMPIPADEQSLSGRVWVGQQDGLIHASSSLLTTRVGDQTLTLALETTYTAFNQPVTIPQVN